MTYTEIIEFIKSSEESDRKYFFDHLVSKLENINNRIDRLSLYMLILLVLYFTIDLQIVSEISIGPFSLKDLNLSKAFIPLVFNYIFFLFASLNAHKSHIIKSIKICGSIVLNIKQSSPELFFYNNSVLKLVIPFSFADEVNSVFIKNGKLGCLSLILMIPIFPLMSIPLIFNILSLKHLIYNYWLASHYFKILIALTAWIFVTTIIYYFKLLNIGMTESRIDVDQHFGS